MKLKIGLTYDLRREYLAEGYNGDDVAEFDSDSTIDELEKAIQSLGYATERIGNAKALCRRLVNGDRWDLVFNIAEGLRGRNREAQVPSILELYDIPYTFSDPLVCAVTLDKAIAKRLVRDAGLPTAEFHVVGRLEDIDQIRIPYPLFAKPVAEGTGKGIDDASRIETHSELVKTCRSLLDKYAQPVLIEEYLPGREFTTGIIGTGDNARVLGSMEVALKAEAGTTVYSYEMKERCEELVEYTRLAPGTLRQETEKLALAAYRTLECRDAARIDIKLNRTGTPVFLELNPLAGLHPTHSDLPMIATHEGISYMQLIGSIIDSAMKRHRRWRAPECRPQE